MAKTNTDNNPYNPCAYLTLSTLFVWILTYYYLMANNIDYLLLHFAFGVLLFLFLITYAYSIGLIENNPNPNLNNHRRKKKDI
jgi:hypothetical protein